MLDLSRAQCTAGGNVARVSLGEILSIDRGPSGLLVASGNVDDVEFAAGGLLSDKFFGRVVRDVVPVDDVVIPVSATELECVGSLETEGSFPASRLGRWVLHHRKWELGFIVVP
jgi:hypothetical protein